MILFLQFEWMFFIWKSEITQENLDYCLGSTSQILEGINLDIVFQLERHLHIALSRHNAHEKLFDFQYLPIYYLCFHHWKEDTIRMCASQGKKSTAKWKQKKKRKTTIYLGCMGATYR